MSAQATLTIAARTSYTLPLHRRLVAANGNGASLVNAPTVNS